ncbi:MAG: hypothetical protein KF889_24770 [Alphaproteobacteria bacterium]|nr:hypothetical protein [Alphaproteobacteria bacterium]MCW5742672.1 hypothetical protein [Alphaproteobacteria bacterium]
MRSREGVAFAGTYALQGDSTWLLNQTMPAGSRYKDAPSYPVTSKQQDDIGLPSSSADFARNANPFTGSRVPGEVNVVR